MMFSCTIDKLLLTNPQSAYMISVIDVISLSLTLSCLYLQLDSRHARRKGLQLSHGVGRPQLVFLYLSVQMMASINFHNVHHPEITVGV